jgi:hypothetical protein
MHWLTLTNPHLNPKLLQVLVGYLDLLEKIIRIKPTAVTDASFGGNLVKTMLKEFLFTMPTDSEQDKVCFP